MVMIWDWTSLFVCLAQTQQMSLRDKKRLLMTSSSPKFSAYLEFQFLSNLLFSKFSVIIKDILFFKKFIFFFYPLQQQHWPFITATSQNLRLSINLIIPPIIQLFIFYKVNTISVCVFTSIPCIKHDKHQTFYIGKLSCNKLSFTKRLICSGAENDLVPFTSPKYSVTGSTPHF